MSTTVLHFLKSVLGVRSVLLSATDVETSEVVATPVLGPIQIFGPARANFGFMLPTSLAQLAGVDGTINAHGWRSAIGETDGGQLEKMILATGHAPESIRLIFVNEDRLGELGPKDLEVQIASAGRWIVMGTSLVSLLWHNKPIISVRGQVLTRGTTYLWPTWGLWEMNANPSLKREVWADMKRAFQGFLIEPAFKK